MPDKLIIVVSIALASGIVFVAFFAQYSARLPPSQSNIVECNDYLCKYQQQVVWDGLTYNADCRDTKCAVDNMLSCKTVSVAALFGDGNNATIIRVYRGYPQPTNGSFICWIDVIRPHLLQYTWSPISGEYSMNMTMVNCDVTGKNLSNWHGKTYNNLISMLTTGEPGKKFPGAYGYFMMSQFFTHKVYF